MDHLRNENRLRHMPSTRLDQLLNGNMPEWFVNAVCTAFQKLDFGAPYKEAAQGLWDEIVEGWSPEDRQVTVRVNGVDVPLKDYIAPTLFQERNKTC